MLNEHELNCLNTERLSEFIKTWMDSRNSKRTTPLSLRSVAANLGISPSMLSRLISGTRNLSTESYLELSEKMKLSPEEKAHFQRLTESARLTGPSRKRNDSPKTPRYGTRRTPRGNEALDPIESRLLAALIEITRDQNSTIETPIAPELLPNAKEIMNRCLDELARLARESNSNDATKGVA